MTKFQRFALALLVASVAFGFTAAWAGSGTGTISTVVDNLDETYDLTLSSVSGMTVGDHLHARLSSGEGAVYEVSAINTSTLVVTVTDTLTEENGAAFGAPTTGTFGYDTPTSCDPSLSLIPYGSPGWDAGHRRNFHLLAQNSALLAYSGEASVSSDTASYAAARTYTAPADLFTRVGMGLRIKCNVRQAAGTGVNLRLDVGGTNCTALTAVGAAEFVVMRTNADSGNGLSVFSSLLGSSASQYAKDDLTGMNWTSTITFSVEIQGGDTNGGTGTDYWTVELLR